jgi:hypothetical protein
MAVTAVIAGVSFALSRRLLRFSRTAPNPAIDGMNVVARPDACAVNSCHQS